jgi:hypothetical protein
VYADWLKDQGVEGVGLHDHAGLNTVRPVRPERSPATPHPIHLDHRSRGVLLGNDDANRRGHVRLCRPRCRRSAWSTDTTSPTLPS